MFGRIKYIISILLFLGPLQANSQNSTSILVDTVDVSGYYVNWWERGKHKTIQSGFYEDSLFENKYDYIFNQYLEYAMRDLGVYFLTIYNYGRTYEINECFFKNTEFRLPYYKASTDMPAAIRYPSLYNEQLYKYGRRYFSVSRRVYKCVRLRVIINCFYLLDNLGLETTLKNKEMTILVPILWLKYDSYIDAKKFGLKKVKHKRLESY